MDAAHIRTWHWIALFVFCLIPRIGLGFALRAHQRGLETAHHEHASIARSLAEGQGFRYNFFGRLDAPVPSSHQAPLVPGLLAGSYLVFGIETPAAFSAMIVLQVVIASATVLLMAQVAGTLAPRGELARWTIATGLFGAAYPPLVASALHVQALVWNLFWLALLLWSTQRLRRQRDLQSGMVFVLAGIGALLTDPILACAVGALLLLTAVESPTDRALQSDGWLTRGLFAAALAAGIAIGISPWMVRNVAVHGRLVPIKSSLPFVFWQGNHPASVGTDKLPVTADAAERLRGARGVSDANQEAFLARANAVSVNDVLSPATIVYLQSLPTEMDRMDFFRTLAWRNLVADPWHYVRLCVRRSFYLLWFDPTNPRSYLWHYRASYWTLVWLALLGLLRCRGELRQTRPVAWSMVALAAVHVLVITSARFRIPLELLLVPFAGGGLAWAFAQVAEALRRWMPRWSPSMRTPAGEW